MEAVLIRVVMDVEVMERRCWMWWMMGGGVERFEKKEEERRECHLKYKCPMPGSRSEKVEQIL